MYAFAFRRDFMLYGEPIIWIRAMGQCPCTNPLTNAFDNTHALCGGTGFLREPINVSRYKALVHSVTNRNKYDRKFGDIKEGDLVLSTWPSEIPWDENDVIIVPSRTTTRTELIKRGAGASDALTQPYAVSIERIYSPTAAVSSANFSLTNSAVATPGQVTWSNSLAQGTVYSVRYTYSPRYTVVAGSILHRKPDLMGGQFPQSGQLRLMSLTPTDGQ